MNEETAVARSRDAFRTLFPSYATSEVSDEVRSSLVLRDGVPVDINAGGRPFYGGDARDIAAKQVSDFLAQPLRLVMSNFNEAGLLTPLCAKLAGRLLSEIGGGEQRMPNEKSSFLVIFGLGLGYHLNALIRGTRARWIIVVEPVREFIALSPEIVDWREVADVLDERQGKLHFVTELDPAQMVAAISRCINRHGASYIDGSWVFTHYPLWAFVEGRQRFLADADNMFAQCGFFEDELKMTRNAAGNFAAAPFWLLNGEKRLRRPETAVVIGAGPSLDEALDKLKEIRDRVVMFSAGTALRPLLRNGITPDFHCELENVPEVFEQLQEAGKHGDLSQIALIGSLSLDSRISSLFGERIFFFRENSSGTALFKGKYEPLLNAVPTCVNTALSAASFLGFTDFLLFGTDCGVRPGRADHAEGTIYQDLWKDRPEFFKKYPLEVEGNFGGVAMTDWVFDTCRRILALAISRFGLSAANCSDGALIPGATPKVPDAVEVKGTPILRERMLDELKRSMIAFRPGELLAAFDVAAIRDMNRAMFRELGEIVDRFDPDVPDFSGLHAALVEFEEAASRRYAQIHRISEGTVVGLARIAMYCGSRIADEDQRRGLSRIVLDYLREAFAEMERRTEELMEEVQAYAERFSSAGTTGKARGALVS
jgi:Glycosyltransferase Maf N-terminal domain/Protein of unknown function DUF115